MCGIIRITQIIEVFDPGPLQRWWLMFSCHDQIHAMKLQLQNSLLHLPAGCEPIPALSSFLLLIKTI